VSLQWRILWLSLTGRQLFRSPELEWVGPGAFGPGGEHAESRELVFAEEVRAACFREHGDRRGIQSEPRNDKRTLLEERIVPDKIGRIPGVSRIESNDVSRHRVDHGSGSGEWPNEILSLDATQRQLDQ